MALLHLSVDQPSSAETAQVASPPSAARTRAAAGGRSLSSRGGTGGHGGAGASRWGRDRSGRGALRAAEDLGTREDVGARVDLGARAVPAAPVAGSSGLPPSVARVAARTRLSAELLAAILEVDGRSRASLDDMERADALAERLLVRRGRRLAGAGRGDSARRASA